ncbi:hypothetical protein [Nocardia sp. NPDC051570]|uniref:hypothetical protein n=1 Tax=Nocardia sp. NPDC051570 TaxID=3364324 RepID=UPI0037A5F18D
MLTRRSTLAVSTTAVVLLTGAGLAAPVQAIPAAASAGHTIAIGVHSSLTSLLGLGKKKKKKKTSRKVRDRASALAAKAADKSDADKAQDLAKKAEALSAEAESTTSDAAQKKDLVAAAKDDTLAVTALLKASGVSGADADAVITAFEDAEKAVEAAANKPEDEKLTAAAEKAQDDAAAALAKYVKL